MATRRETISASKRRETVSASKGGDIADDYEHDAEADKADWTDKASTTGC